MAIVKVLSVAISDEFPEVIVAAAHKIRLPVQYTKSLTKAAGFPSLVDYMYWDDINEQLEVSDPYATVEFSVTNMVDILAKQAADEKFEYDPDVIAPGEYSKQDLAINFSIERLRKIFVCAFVHNSRA
jgi:hypothetical protein